MLDHATANMDGLRRVCQGRAASVVIARACSSGENWAKTRRLDPAVGSTRVIGMSRCELFRGVGWIGLALTFWADGGVALAGDPRLNQIQVIGTHNSYHVAPAPAVLEWIASTGRRRAEGLDYTHRPLAEQFSRLGIRQIELDVFADPKGGLFAEPSLRKILQD